MTCTSVLRALALGVLLQAAGVWAAGVTCGGNPGDAAAIAAARAEIEETCNCAGAPDHGAYVRCASDVLAARVASGDLRGACKGTLKKCTARSTCGRAGSVTCCRTNAVGRLKCSVKKDAARCRAPSGGTACVGTASSCCDACGNGGCAPATTTSSTTSTIMPSTTTPTTSSTSTTLGACGGTFPICNGSCGAGEYCTEDGLPGTSCVCMPLGLESCGGAAYPTCGGTCTGSGVCGRVTIYTSTTGYVNSCACLDPAATCSGSFNDAMCPGVCPAGTTCYGEPEPAGIGNCVGCLPLILFP